MKPWEIELLYFFFIRTKALILAKEQAMNKVRLAVPQNIRAKCLGQDIRTG